MASDHEWPRDNKGPTRSPLRLKIEIAKFIDEAQGFEQGKEAQLSETPQKKPELEDIKAVRQRLQTDHDKIFAAEDPMALDTASMGNRIHASAGSSSAFEGCAVALAALGDDIEKALMPDEGEHEATASSVRGGGSKAAGGVAPAPSGGRGKRESTVDSKRREKKHRLHTCKIRAYQQGPPSTHGASAEAANLGVQLCEVLRGLGGRGEDKGLGITCLARIEDCDRSSGFGKSLVGRGSQWRGHLAAPEGRCDQVWTRRGADCQPENNRAIQGQMRPTPQLLPTPPSPTQPTQLPPMPCARAVSHSPSAIDSAHVRQ